MNKYYQDMSYVLRYYNKTFIRYINFHKNLYLTTVYIGHVYNDYLFPLSEDFIPVYDNLEAFMWLLTGKQTYE